MNALPTTLDAWTLSLADNGRRLDYSFNADDEQACVPALLKRLHGEGIEFTNLNTRQSTLEEIFVDLVHNDGPAKRNHP